MKALFIAAVLCGMLSACAPQGARLVNALDGAQFVTMSRAMRPAMLERGLVDAQGDWYSPLLSFPPKDAGAQLVDRLSPAFRFPGSRVAMPRTFRAMLTSEAKVRAEGNRAVIEQGLSLVELALTALADWNGDGRDDWLVSCRVSFVDTPRRYREYFLVISRTDAPVLEPAVLLVRDHVYGKVTVTKDASAGVLAETPAAEFLQGQTTVTQQPDSRAVQKKLSEGSSVQESALSQ